MNNRFTSLAVNKQNLGKYEQKFKYGNKSMETNFIYNQKSSSKRVQNFFNRFLEQLITNT